MAKAPPARLTSRRLVLRKVRSSDLEYFYDHARYEVVAKNAGFPSPRSIQDTRAFIRRAQTGWKTGVEHLYSIVLKDGTWVGGVGIRWPHPGVGELGYSVHPDHWGNGYAPEAARRLTLWALKEGGAHRVQATCWVKNSKSAKVLRKVGMRKEGTLRSYLKRGDWVRDEYIFGITRKDVR